MAHRYNVFLHVVVLFFGTCCCLVTNMNSRVGGAALSAVCFSVLIPASMLPLAAYSYHLVVLSKESFEFWFLTALNVCGCCFCSALLRDARVMVAAVASVISQHGLLLDGNIHTRRFILRTFMIASPLIIISILPLALRYTPRLRATTISFGPNINADIMDIMVHCYSTLAIFIGSKVFGSRHLVLPAREPIQSIECSVYLPVCYLVHVETLLRPRMMSLRGIDINSQSVPLKMVSKGVPLSVDTNDNLNRTMSTARMCLWLNVLGNVGWICSWVPLTWYMAQPNSLGEPLPSQLTLAYISVLATLLFTVIYTLNAPLVLLRRLMTSLDAWFVSFQITVVTIGVCDTMQWDCRSIFTVPMWLWCPWTMILDTFTPLTRRRLRFQRWLLRAVFIMLMADPALVAYWIFYSNFPGLRNRVLFNVSIFGSTVRMEAFSMLVTWVWTVSLWMARLLWLELFRSADSFKLLKFRVEYPVTEAIWPT